MSVEKKDISVVGIHTERVGGIISEFFKHLTPRILLELYCLYCAVLFMFNYMELGLHSS